VRRRLCFAGEPADRCEFLPARGEKFTLVDGAVVARTRSDQMDVVVIRHLPEGVAGTELAALLLKSTHRRQ
jgi:hypothetical protein